jgi:hypothetical protein
MGPSLGRPSLAQALLALPALVIAAFVRDITGPQCGPFFVRLSEK